MLTGLSYIACNSCYENLCTACIQPEIHACPSIAAKKQIELKNLETQLITIKDKSEWVVGAK